MIAHTIDIDLVDFFKNLSQKSKKQTFLKENATVHCLSDLNYPIDMVRSKGFKIKRDPSLADYIVYDYGTLNYFYAKLQEPYSGNYMYATLKKSQSRHIDNILTHKGSTKLISTFDIYNHRLTKTINNYDDYKKAFNNFNNNNLLVFYLSNLNLFDKKTILYLILIFGFYKKNEYVNLCHNDNFFSNYILPFLKIDNLVSNLWYNKKKGVTKAIELSKKAEDFDKSVFKEIIFELYTEHLNFFELKDYFKKEIKLIFDNSKF